MSGFARAVWSAMTWRRILVAQVAGQLSVALVSTEGPRFGTRLGHPSLHNVAAAASALLLLLLTLAVDEAMARGARPRRAVPLTVLAALAVACAATGLADWGYQAAFHLPGPVNSLQRYGFISTGIGIGTTGAFVMLVYLNRRTVERMLEGVRDAELRRVQLERRLIESRLAAAEAQIDPQMLFTSLAQIRSDLQRSAPDADTKIEGLVQRLRNALARTVVAADAESGAVHR